MYKDRMFPTWDQDDPRGSLLRLYDWAVENAQKQINWYDRKRRPKRIASQWLLGIAVLFGGIGILAPLIDAACDNCAIPLFDCSVSFLQLGYIALALAGIVILFDRTYGLSVGWMRFMETQMMIERSLNQFRFEWSEALAEKVTEDKEEEHLKKLLSLLHDFINKVDELIIGETKAWTVDFRQNLTDIDKLTKNRNP